MKIDADFTQISSSFEPLDGTFRMRLERIDNQAEDAEWQAKNATSDKQAALVFVSEVTEGERISSQYFDYVYTKTKEGKPNKIGLGRIKAYAEAILGKEAASSPSGIDLDAVLSGQFDGVFMLEKYKDAATGLEKTTSRLKKILPVG